MKICPSCQINYEESSKFCRKCGGNLLYEQATPAAPLPSDRPQVLRRSTNTTTIAVVIGAGVLGLVLLVVLIWRPVNGPPQTSVVKQPDGGRSGAVTMRPYPAPKTTGGVARLQGTPQHPPLIQAPLDRFQVGRQWSIDWQSMFRYQGVMRIQKQLGSNRYLARISISFFNKNKQINVSMDGLMTIHGEDVVINCTNASKSWWDTDDFYLKWHNGTMTGYNIDKKGRRGNAVFRFLPG
jgi:hypothetical protein